MPSSAAPFSSGARISVSHLTKSFGTRPAVRDVSLEVGTGITGLLGPNGAGKSTLLRCLVGLSGWDSGEVHIGGLNLARRPREARRKIGFMPERVSFPAEMRVEEYLHFAASAKGIARSQRSAAVEGSLDRAGLTGVRDRIVGNLSKGYRQRVGLAQALLGDAPFIVLDEPSAGLDPLNVMDLRSVLRGIAAERSVLVSTHLLPEARLLCDRVIVMSEGSVVYDGPTAGMTSGGGQRQLRIRVRRATGGDEVPAVAVAGTTLVARELGGASRRDGDHVLVVDADDEAAGAALVASLVTGGWAVLDVESTTDALEDAFRHAVLGNGGEPAP